MLKKFLTWPAILLMLAMAALIAFMGHKERSETSRLVDHGKTASATIEEVKWTSKRGMDRNFDLTLAFTTAAGQSVKEILRVDTDTGKRARDDDSFVEVPVTYLPEDPTVVRLAGEPDASMRMFVIAGILALAGAILLVLRLRAKDV